MTITQQSIHKLNTFLSIIVMGLAVYILVIPFLPEITFALKGFTNAQVAEEGSTVAQSKAETQNENNSGSANRVIIPKIGVDSQILQGDSALLLDKGIWHRPNTTTPDMGGNMVLVGHRFLYTSGPDTFYHLPKMQVGDTVEVTWNNENYTYEVFETLTVTAQTVSIEENTDEDILTLYTCTPLWNPTHRFVVRAKKI